MPDVDLNSCDTIALPPEMKPSRQDTMEQGPSLLENFGGKILCDMHVSMLFCISHKCNIFSVAMMTSPCSLNRSTTFLENWQNGRQITKMIYFGPSAPKPQDSDSH